MNFSDPIPERPRVLAVLLPARYEVESVLETGQKLRDLRGVVLEVGVQGDDDRPPSLTEAHGERGGLAEVAPELEAPHPGILEAQLLDPLEGAVAAPGVDEEDFGPPTEALERLGQLAMEDAQAVDLV